MGRKLSRFTGIIVFCIFWLIHAAVEVLPKPLCIHGALSNGVGTLLGVFYFSRPCSPARWDLFPYTKGSHNYRGHSVRLPVLLNGVRPRKMAIEYMGTGTHFWKLHVGVFGYCTCTTQIYQFIFLSSWIYPYPSHPESLAAILQVLLMIISYLYQWNSLHYRCADTHKIFNHFTANAVHANYPWANYIPFAKVVITPFSCSVFKRTKGSH